VTRSRSLLKAETDYFGLFPPHALLMWEVEISRPKTRDRWYDYSRRYRQLYWVDENGRDHHPCNVFSDGKLNGGENGPIPEPIDWATHCAERFPAEVLDKFRADGWEVTVWIPDADQPEPVKEMQSTIW
jgi:hypothetical protein